MNFGLTSTASQQCNQSAYGRVLGDRSKRFVIVFTPTLSETFRAETCFMEAIVLNTQNPTGLDNSCIPWPGYELPGLVLMNRGKFSFHSLLPLFRILLRHSFHEISRPCSCNERIRLVTKCLGECKSC